MGKHSYYLTAVALLALSQNSQAEKFCQSMGTLNGEESVFGYGIIDSLESDGKLQNCQEIDDTTNNLTRLSIEFSSSFLDTLPAQPVDGSASDGGMPDTHDGKLLSDLRVCNFKQLPSVGNCAKGYRAFGDFPKPSSDHPINMTMVEWAPLGLYKWHKGLHQKQIGFHFYFDAQYPRIVDIHPGWTDDHVHVEENSNKLVQIGFNQTLIPEDYIRLEDKGARAGIGGFMLRLPDVILQHDLLWGYYGGRPVFIRPTFLLSALEEIRSECKLDQSDSDAQPEGLASETEGSGDHHLIPCQKAHWCFDIAQPRYYQTAGKYPRKSCIYYDQGSAYEYSVTLEDFSEVEVLPPSANSKPQPTDSSSSAVRSVISPLLLLLLLSIFV